MRLPSVALPINDWNTQTLEQWKVLEEKAAQLSEAAGNNNAFERKVAKLQNMASTGRFGNLLVLLKRRLTARALTWLWLNDETFASRTLNPQLLDTLVKAQEPRLTRITLQQLTQLYFRRFDELDRQGELREMLEKVLLQQLAKIPSEKIEITWVDPLVTLQREGSWLLNLDGPAALAKRVREDGRELGQTFVDLGLQGFDNGRYGDVCRAHFYLETLKKIPLGQSDPVLDELLKPSVSKAPYEGTRRIGHVALEILIDRVVQGPSEVWQDFILNLAGDPRIASSAPNYREWWQPQGKERIQKVRGWLSKEDLRLFLRALEQYGVESQNDELQRMFPARRIFLEGLFKLKKIRNTRLLLGSRASQAVKRILGKDVKTSFASMDASMNDKAVIYLDCGDFHIVEGSHSFKIWVYLAPPSDSLRFYEKNRFSHFDLTRVIPKEYKKTYPKLPFGSYTHSPGTWQNNVFTFLANNGIELDIEQMLSPSDYQSQLRKFGIPYVNPNPVINRRPVVYGVSNDQNNRQKNKSLKGSSFVSDSREKLEVSIQATSCDSSPEEQVDKVTKRNNSRIKKTRRERKTYKPYEASSRLKTKSVVGGRQRTRRELSMARIGDGKVTKTSSKHELAPRISRLSSFELQVLRYFNDNPGDRARFAAEVLGVDRTEVNRALYGTLKALCRQDDYHGWKLTDSARLELDVFDQQGE